MPPRAPASRASMAAAAKHDKSNNDDPAAAVIATEKSAETVVIHSRSSLYELGRAFPLPAIIVWRCA